MLTKQKAKSMKRICSLLFLFFILCPIFAQEHQGKINGVQTNGLHQIVLSPEVRSLLSNDVNHLRIFDARNKEVPFIVFKRRFSGSTFDNFTILSKKYIPNAMTTVIISNENKINLDRMELKISNTDVSKKYNISGSNDSISWFGLVNDQQATNLYAEGTTFKDCLFYFPLNNYKYLKFDFIDTNSLPINILSAGLKKGVTIEDSKIEISDFVQKITTDQKSKQSRINISFSSPQVLNSVRFDISEPNHYVRKARLLVDKKRIYKNKEESYKEVINTFELNSKTSNIIDLENLFLTDLSLVVDNEDNPELLIDNISFYQNPLYILADLNSNEKYTVLLNSNFSKPDYDLAESGIDLTIEYPTATIEDIEGNSTVNVNSTEMEAKSFWQTPTFMWICIVLSASILGYFSRVMVIDMNKNKKD